MKTKFILLGFVLIQAIIFISLNIHLRYTVKPQANLILLTNILVIINTTISLLFSKNYFGIEEKNLLIEQHNKNLENINRLMFLLKTQRHDFLNHIQVLFGLLSMNKFVEAKDYLKKYFEEVTEINAVIRINNPILEAFLQQKKIQASQKNIDFSIKVYSDLKLLAVSHFDLVTILGNLINNAFEALELQPIMNRWAKLEIEKDAENYIIKLSDSGVLPGEILPNIFNPGFSTKKNERGIGLTIVKEYVELNNGTIEVYSKPYTQFILRFPRKDQ